MAHNITVICTNCTKRMWNLHLWSNAQARTQNQLKTLNNRGSVGGFQIIFCNFARF